MDPTAQPALLFHPMHKMKQLFLNTGFTGVNFSGKSVQIAAGRRDRFETWNRTKQAPPVFFLLQVGGFCKVQLLLPHP